MLALKATKKEMRNGYDKIIRIGYCNLQHLLDYAPRIAYSARAEGWACDYYDIDGVLISTGYAPLSSKNVKSVDYETIRKYNEEGAKLRGDFSIPYEAKKAEAMRLLSAFVAEVA